MRVLLLLICRNHDRFVKRSNAEKKTAAADFNSLLEIISPYANTIFY